ncbi:uncharacterized protein C1orf198 homolog [Bacillus rossius redtenbacheri]|uniref:uncharacterized protein C1orf198 homolog n=1 Tax=Bacillus rossius redtenbacheri TaxID=93214 RepID=UPI002FDDD4A5
MNENSLQNIAKNYFGSLNPIAEKISVDIAATKDAYEDLWNTLSYKEQNKIIDETIIYPEVVLKYSFCPQCDENIEYVYSYLQLGEKYGEFSWHDEHSAPFSWMTRSQLDLKISCDHEAVYPGDEVPAASSFLEDQKTMSVLTTKESFIDPPGIVLGGSTSKFANPTEFENKYTSKANNNEERTLFGKIKFSAAILKNQTIKSALNKAGIDSSHKKFAGCENDVLLKTKNKCTVVPSSKILKQSVVKPVILKPKSPPPPPPNRSKSLLEENFQNFSETKSLLHESLHVTSKNYSTKPDLMNKTDSFDTNQKDTSSQSVDISVPKTGFDFLDNW